jgi:hypothetical protein
MKTRILVRSVGLALALCAGAAQAQSPIGKENIQKKIKIDSASSLLGDPETKEVKAKREKNRREKLVFRSQSQGMNAKYIQSVRNKEKTRLEKEKTGKTPQVSGGAKTGKK